MDILVELFGSQTLVKIIRLFYVNPEGVFEVREISKKVMAPYQSVASELRVLERIAFIKKATKTAEVISRTKKAEKKRVSGWSINKTFAFFRPLKNLVLNAAPISRDKIFGRLKKSGRLTLVILAGIFIDRALDEPDSEGRYFDLLVVGDGIKKSALDSTVRSLESQLGKELVYSVFSTKEFLYRLSMRDKFIRDILDYPHEKILNKLDI
ncbi:MAG: hypothetical protein AAB930_01190 [Patescibacteria group bacterium]